MKKIFAILAVAVALSACNKDKNDSNTPIPAPAFAKGADIGWASEMEKGGKTFKKQDGTQADLLDVLKDVGVNAIRLRVWVNPYGGWSGKDDVVNMAKRVQKAGLPLMVDFHYSDFFTDPSRQGIPEAWAADKADLGKMAAHVTEHTKDVLTALKNAGVTPAWVQIGNETRNGMLWPIGQLWSVNGSTPGGWANFTKLYMAGYNAAKEVFPNIIAMPHVNNAFDDNDWWFKALKEQGGKFDMIALSHYPQAQSKMTAEECNTQAFERIKALSSKYGVKVMVSEVGVKTPDNETLAKQTLESFMNKIKGSSACAGVFYWEPEVYNWWKPAVYDNASMIEKYTGKKETWGSYNMGAFLSSGRPSSVLDCFKD